jgi:hypothetical protein
MVKLDAKKLKLNIKTGSLISPNGMVQKIQIRK